MLELLLVDEKIYKGWISLKFEMKLIPDSIIKDGESKSDTAKVRAFVRLFDINPILTDAQNRKVFDESYYGSTELSKSEIIDILRKNNILKDTAKEGLLGKIKGYLRERAIFHGVFPPTNYGDDVYVFRRVDFDEKREKNLYRLTLVDARPGYDYGPR